MASLCLIPTSLVLNLGKNTQRANAILFQTVDDGVFYLKRRTVSTITKYLEPKKIFKLITAKSWSYAPTSLREVYECRDKAFMGSLLVSAGRITALVGGPHYFIKNSCLECKGNVQRIRVKDTFNWVCEECKTSYGPRKPREIGKLMTIGLHEGLRRKNIEMGKDAIRVVQMKVIKRKMKTIKKYGAAVTIREDFMFPLKRGLYESEFGDQLVPFSWLLKEYLNRFMSKADSETRLFRFSRGRGWQIVKEITGLFPNWFRAQAEHFYGHYLIQDSVRLSKFVGVVNPYQVAHYIGFSYESLLKDKRRHMDFNWIDREVRKIKARINI